MPPAYLAGPPVAAQPEPYTRGCTGWRPLSVEQARAAAARRGGHAYQCAACNFWHATRRLAALPQHRRPGGAA